jgi:hypothetical protein
MDVWTRRQQRVEMCTKKNKHRQPAVVGCVVVVLSKKQERTSNGSVTSPIRVLLIDLSRKMLLFLNKPV